MDGDVVPSMVVNTNDNCVTLAGFDGWPWELAVHRQDILGVTEPSVRSFFYLQQLGNHHKLWKTDSNLCDICLQANVKLKFCIGEWKRVLIWLLIPWGNFSQDTEKNLEICRLIRNSSPRPKRVHGDQLP